MVESLQGLAVGADAGLSPKIYADAFENLRGTRLPVALRATSGDHLLQSTDDAEVTPVLLPEIAFGLGGEYPVLGPFRGERPVLLRVS